MKVYLNILLSFSLILVFGCGSSPSNKKELSTEDVLLVDILSDIHIAEAGLRRYLEADRDSILKHFKGQVFRIHEVEQSWFDSTMHSVILDQPRYLKVYSAVSDTIDTSYKQMRVK